MPKIDVSKCGGNVDVAIRKLKRICDRLGILKRMRDIERHVKNSEKKRLSKGAAIRRSQKKKIAENLAINQNRRRRK